MSTSMHKVARLVDGKEKFVIVQVDAKWAKEYGEKEINDAISTHPGLTLHGMPILTAHVEGTKVTYFGKGNLVDDVAAFGWDNIEWDEEEIPLEWEDEDGEEEGEEEEEDEE